MKKGKEVKLSLLERMVISNLLPVEGKFEYLIIKKELLEKIEISQEEVKKFNIKELDNGSITFNNPKDKFSYNFTELESEAIKKELNRLEELEKLNESHIDLYKEFCR